MKVLFACGGSGGHIFPAMSAAAKLKQRPEVKEILFVCSLKIQDAETIAENNYAFRAICISPLSYSFLSLNYWKSLIKLVCSFIQCFIIIREYRPDCVVGFGGYVSLPVVFVARLFKIPALIHEQNLIIGSANRFLSLIAKKIALSFKESSNFFRSKSKIIITGNPVRFDMLENITRVSALEKFDLGTEKTTILVFGGSQGSSKINQTLTEMFNNMGKLKRDKLQIIHITGKNDYKFIEEQYQKLDIKYRCYSFLKDINYAYVAADLVISRAGASAISEISYFRKPAILIPYPGKKVHQKDNALFLSKNEAAVVIADERLSASGLKDEITSLLQDKTKMQSMSDKICEFFYPDAADKLADAILNLR